MKYDQSGVKVYPRGASHENRVKQATLRHEGQSFARSGAVLRLFSRRPLGFGSNIQNPPPWPYPSLQAALNNSIEDLWFTILLVYEYPP